MIDRAPTIAELRARVQKDRYREIGNWLARNVARPTAVYGCWLAIRLRLSAHQVTVIALCSWLVASAAIGTGHPFFFILGAALVQLAYWLDHVDGQVARWHGTSSLDGVYLDYLMHHAANLTLGFGLGFGLALKLSEPRWAIAGFAIGLGWSGLSLHNDCRYKAFFQRLKSAKGSYRVDGGAAARPHGPAPWPSRGRAALTWPAFKICEVHVVNIALAALASLAIAHPPVWLVCWQAYVVIMAVLAPALAIGRSIRSVNHRAAESEFALWFQPLEPTPSIEAPAAPSNASP